MIDNNAISTILQLIVVPLAILALILYLRMRSLSLRPAAVFQKRFLKHLGDDFAVRSVRMSEYTSVQNRSTSCTKVALKENCIGKSHVHRLHCDILH